MVSAIPPSGSNYPSYGASDSNAQSIINQMMAFEQEVRDAMGPPPQEQKLEELLNKMQSFMTKNQQAIYAIMEKNGFPVDGPFSISTEFNSAMSAIKNYLQHPNDQGSLYLLNESVTQINFYLKHTDLA